MATFTTSLASVTFTVESSSYDEKRDAKVAVTDIPGGDVFYVDRAGRGPLRVSFGILVANSTIWGTLNSALILGQSGTLSIEGLDSHTATLVATGRPAAAQDGQILGSAEFLITDA